MYHTQNILTIPKGLFQKEQKETLAKKNKNRTLILTIPSTAYAKSKFKY